MLKSSPGCSQDKTCLTCFMLLNIAAVIWPFCLRKSTLRYSISGMFIVFIVVWSAYLEVVGLASLAHDL
jgi:hypothetical protein